ncbi:MAG: ATP-dependent zinc metalloprotease FtsH [Spirochaetia bacterium]|nr:ATP-dependent zinc metalloprotease FtsH [Spirochaetia bacterium]MBQ6673998.1 ATP-dependent zinc metalloprotease FtsH [Spirochaetia bacterium]
MSDNENEEKDKDKEPEIGRKPDAGNSPEQGREPEQKEDENNQDENPMFIFRGGAGPLKLGFNNRFAFFILTSLIIMFLFMFVFNTGETAMEEISYSTFLNYLENKSVESVKIVDNEEIQGYLTNVSGQHTAFKTRIPYFDDKLLQRLEESGVKITGGVKNMTTYRLLVDIVPWLIGLTFIWIMFRNMSGGNKAMGFGKSRAKRYDSNGKKVMFADVAGQDEAKYELEEVVDFLKNPKKFTDIGAKIPKGVLLVGMPGTGKTLLAKAIAGEAGVPYFHMSGSDFVEMFVGVGASRVRDLFEQGRKNAPCIIFIDELDAVGRTRGAGYGGGHDEREQTLNQMLVEMDGFDSKDGVIILAATNRPDVLDPALLRPGRFDRQVVVDMPDVKEREAIFRLHASKIPVDGEVDMERLARATPGSSGAEIANMVNEAALFAARKNKKKVTMEDFEEALDKVMMGVARKSKVITDDDKKATAFHEAGHALLHYFLKYSDPLHKVTIIPRGRALGMAMSLPEKDSYSRNKMWLKDRIKICLGGYIAEQMIYGWTTTGTQNDLQQAAQLARKMVCEWGMSDILGPVAFGQEDEPIFIGKEIAQHKDYSEATAQAIDNEVKHIIDECFQDAQAILKENRDKLEKLADTLFEKETLDDSEIRELLNLPKKEEEPAQA